MIDYILKARFLQRLKCHDMKLNFDKFMFDVHVNPAYFMQ